MGLYQSELTKQRHLKKMQKKEWDMMKKKMAEKQQHKNNELNEQQTIHDQEEREQNLVELRETEASKKLASAMVKSSLERKDDTLQKAVDLLHNQNGNLREILLNAV